MVSCQGFWIVDFKRYHPPVTFCVCKIISILNEHSCVFKRNLNFIGSVVIFPFLLRVNDSLPCRIMFVTPLPCISRYSSAGSRASRLARVRGAWLCSRKPWDASPLTGYFTGKKTRSVREFQWLFRWGPRTNVTVV